MRLASLRMPVCVGLALLLVQLPVRGGNSQVGRVIPRTGTSAVNGTDLLLDTTLYSGDLVSTQPEGSALVLASGGGRVLLGPSSSVSLAEYDNGLGLTLSRGVVRVHTSGIAVLANGVVVRAAGDRGIFEVGLEGTDALLVFAISGDVEVQATNNTVVVPMDQVMRFEIKDVAGLAANPAGANSITPKRMAIAWLIVTGATAGAIYFLLRSNLNELKDICRQLNNQISPSQPLPPECN